MVLLALSLSDINCPCYTAYMVTTSKQKKPIAGIIFTILFLIVTSIILLFASFNGEVSSGQSDFVASLINDVLRFMGIILNTTQLEGLAFFARKLLGHFLIFAVDGVFFLLAFHGFRPNVNKWWTLLISIASLLVVAFFSELIQFFTSGRSGNWLDVGIDLSGALVGIGVAWLCFFMKIKKAGVNPAS